MRLALWWRLSVPNHLYMPAIILPADLRTEVGDDCGNLPASCRLKAAT